MNVSDGSLLRVPDRRAATVAWSPDSRYLAYAPESMGGPTDSLIVYDLQEKRVKRLLKTERDQANIPYFLSNRNDARLQVPTRKRERAAATRGCTPAHHRRDHMVKTRREVLRRLATFSQQHGSEFGVRRIGVFGSAAHDQLTRDSDVDVVVELAEPDLLLLVGIQQELQSLLGRPVDVVHYRPRMNPVLKHYIDAEAIYAS